MFKDIIYKISLGLLEIIVTILKIAVVVVIYALALSPIILTFYTSNNAWLWLFIPHGLLVLYTLGDDCYNKY